MSKKRPGRWNPTLQAVVDAETEPAPEPIKSRRVQSVYFAHLPEARRVKIGFSQNPRQRVARLRSTTGGLDLDLIGAVDGGRITERVLHERFAEHRISGEWFSDEILPDLEEIIQKDREWFGEEVA